MLLALLTVGNVLSVEAQRPMADSDLRQSMEDGNVDERRRLRKPKGRNKRYYRENYMGKFEGPKVLRQFANQDGDSNFLPSMDSASSSSKKKDESQITVDSLLGKAPKKPRMPDHSATSGSSGIDLAALYDMSNNYLPQYDHKSSKGTHTNSTSYSKSSKSSKSNSTKSSKSSKGFMNTTDSDSKSSKSKRTKGDKKGTKKSKGLPDSPISAPALAPYITPVVAPALVPIIAPVLFPVIGPFSLPTTAPVLSPTIAPAPRSCVPTTGPCASTDSEIQALLANSNADDVVAVCASATPVTTSTALLIDQDNVTICCQGLDASNTCLLRSSGTDNILDGFAASVRLQDLIFEDGVESSFSFGGNVFIDGDGDHYVENCVFRNGTANNLGGNLFVQTRGSITVEGSTFEDGQVEVAGGGMYIFNAEEAVIRGSQFISNNADMTGGGLFSTLQENTTDYSQTLTIQNTLFRSNTATVGGGFFVTGLGPDPILNLLNSDFESNSGSDAAGAGAIGDSLDVLDLTVTSSSGSMNTGPVCPELLGFFDGAALPQCLLLSDDRTP